MAKIEELFTRLDAGLEALKKVKAQLKAYRQAVLRDAFAGRLTAEWREAHGGEMEPASVLLERIKEERRRQAGGKLKELPPVDTSDLPELPEGWAWTRLGESAEMVNPGFPSGKHNKERIGVPHLRPMNINIKGEIDLSDLKYVESEDHDCLLKGDVLFNNTNSPELLGKTAWIRQDTNWAYSNHMTRIRLNVNLLNPPWIACCLHSLFLNGFFRANCVHHVNQASIGSSFLAERVIIPLPPLPEQQRIVEEIERRFSVADQIEKTVERGLKQAERLRQSILKRAFEGKLVPQDPTDEPAERLLERIKAERASRELQARPARKARREATIMQRLSQKGSAKGRSPFVINSSPSPFQGEGDKGGEVLRQPLQRRLL
ncbi:MAG: restriction endonuclease subunit S [Chloroflexi bacterium]|nr:restriction endonuclease subunit S [Chloroflexota bacterium]MCL5076297.1 restriction endonuclease subunit S [Chloroflexota bacterium]